MEPGVGLEPWDLRSTQQLGLASPFARGGGRKPLIPQSQPLPLPRRFVPLAFIFCPEVFAALGYA